MTTLQLLDCTGDNDLLFRNWTACRGVTAAFYRPCAYTPVMLSSAPAAAGWACSVPHRFKLGSSWQRKGKDLFTCSEPGLKRSVSTLLTGLLALLLLTFGNFSIFSALALCQTLHCSLFSPLCSLLLLCYLGFFKVLRGLGFCCLHGPPELLT